MFKMFLNPQDFSKCSSVSRIPRIPAFGSSENDCHGKANGADPHWLRSPHSQIKVSQADRPLAGANESDKTGVDQSGRTCH